MDMNEMSCFRLRVFASEQGESLLIMIPPRGHVRLEVGSCRDLNDLSLLCPLLYINLVLNTVTTNLLYN